LLDSAVNQFSQPYIKTAAPYLLARAQVRSEAGLYRPAVLDFNEYEQLMTSAQLGAHFYYLREQAEMEGHLYQQALNDIRTATEKAPTEMVYLTEKAAVELRVGLADDAMQTAEAIIRQEPESSDGYLFLGLAQCVKGMKTEGIQNLQKAKELGNSQAQQFIERYSK
jgi:tetratricopeptide (TPR) repeat protein